MAEDSGAFVRVENVKKHFPMKRKLFRREQRHLKAVDDVSFSIARGETLGLVGESGCGKTTTGRTILKLHEPTAGRILYDGADIVPLSRADMAPYRRRMQIIFQDPYASLDPRMTVGDIIAEGMNQLRRVAGKLPQQERARWGEMSGREVRAEVTRLLELVGLHRDHANRFPHEFSGGQRQRIGIARALAVNPEFIVCDEPISSLDVSIQAQIVNTLEDLQNQLGLTYLFIAHDISMVKHISRRIAVMYLGVIVELGESHRLYRNPQHPYTQALLSAVPVPDPDLTRAKERIVLEGDVPSPIEVPKGCRFRGRCRFAMPKCAEAEPALAEVEPGYHVACYLVHDIPADATTNTGTGAIQTAPTAGPKLTEAPTAGGGRGETNTQGDTL